MRPYEHLYIYEIKGEVDDSFIASPDYIGCWNEGESSFLFFHSDQRPLVERMISKNQASRLVDTYNMPYKEWQGGALVPFRVGPLWFRPPTEDSFPPKGCRDVPFDPGVVFGTGLHPTTYDCLYLLVDFFKKNTPETVLDLGTGTGILAVAAALLGAKRVLAVDINRLSVSTARRNVRLNGLGEVLEVKEGDAVEMIEKEADLTLMNIHYSVLDAITDGKAFYRKKAVILSGVLRSDYYMLLKKLQKRRHLVKERRTGHWFSAWFEA
jgi:ribosomal protein L11 methyltransferase